MDLGTAIRFAYLVDAAYAVPPDNLRNRAGEIVKAGAAGTPYEVVTSIYTNDLATDMNPTREKSLVSIGLILQAAGTEDAVIAIRGSEGIMEWIQDAKFLTEPCPFVRGAGNTEDGFTDMYDSMATGTAAGSSSVTKALATLPWEEGCEFIDDLWPQLGRCTGNLARTRCVGERTLSF